MRHVMEQDLRATLRRVRAAYEQARELGRRSDCWILSGMVTSLEYAIGHLTDPHWGDPPRTRPLTAGRSTLTAEQHARLDIVEAMLTNQERHILWLTIAEGASLKGAAVAMGLSLAEAQTIFDSMARKIKTFQRNWFAGAESAD